MKGRIKFVDPTTKDWGFIVPEDGGGDVHFTLRDFVTRKPTIRDYDAHVQFEVEEDNRGRHARSAQLLNAEGKPFPPTAASQRKVQPRLPAPKEFLLDWAYLGYLPKALAELEDLALDERVPLDWAYKNARLICRPDSDWLEPENIVAGAEDEQEGSAIGSA